MIIETKKLYKVFNEGKPNEFIALENINLQVKEGTLLVLNGVSGSGKSTLLSILSGMSKPSSGELVVDSQHIAKLPDLHISKFRNETIGFVFQHFNLFSELSVFENVSISLVTSSISTQELAQRVEDVLKEVNIYHKKDELVLNLSGGEKQRCAIARALVNKPKILLCDEPTAALDEKNTEIFIEILKSLKDKKRTIVIATHDTVFKELDIVDEFIQMQSARIVGHI